MIRRHQIEPDQLYERRDGVQFPIITKAALVQAMIQLAEFSDFAGGTLTLVTERASTGVPHEMVTIGAMIEWKDRADAKAQSEVDMLEPVQQAPIGNPQAAHAEQAAMVDEDLIRLAIAQKLGISPADVDDVLNEAAVVAGEMAVELPVEQPPARPAADAGQPRYDITEDGAVPVAQQAAAPLPPLQDGLDERELEEEDDSAIPAGAGV